ncbi:MAG: beta-ketoacyl-ACP synthase [Myxococcota bacterium]
MTRHPYPITAYSLSCGLGRRTEDAIQKLRAGERGLREVPFAIPFDAITGTLPGALDPLPAHLAHHDSRTARLAALGYAEIQDSVDRARRHWGDKRVAMVLGTSTGGIDRTEGFHFQWFESGASTPATPTGDYDYHNQHCFHAFADVVAALSGIQGPSFVVSTACSSSAKVFSSARRLLDLELADAVLVGGVDGLCNTTVRGFNSLGVMANEPCRPFGAKRPGMNVGEGAAFLLLEREGEPKAWLRGVGETSDAYHMSSPEPEGRGALAAMKTALAEANLQPEDVGYINAHGTGTPYNDAAEAKAIRALFGTRTPVVSTKAYTGHTLGACGAVEAIFSIVALEEGWIPAALGSTPRDEDIDILLPETRSDAPLRYVLSNAFAFGGNNCSVLFERGQA